MDTPKTYAAAFYALAKDEGIDKKLLDELKYLAAVFGENPEYARILDSPLIDKGELMRILNEDFMGKIHRYTLNFIKILSEKHIIHHIGECAAEYERLYNADNNIKTVRVTTAKPLDGERRRMLKNKLSEKFNCSVVILESVNPECIGGLVIEADDVMIDASLKTRLAELRKALIL